MASQDLPSANGFPGSSVWDDCFRILVSFTKNGYCRQVSVLFFLGKHLGSLPSTMAGTSPWDSPWYSQLHGFVEISSL